MSLSAIKESYKTKRCSYGSTLPHSAMTQAWYQTTSQGPLGISDVLKKTFVFKKVASSFSNELTVRTGNVYLINSIIVFRKLNGP